MSEDKFLTIIDYGSSKIRLCVYDKSLPNQKYILDKTCNNDFSSIKTNLNDSEKILQELIHKTEKKINNHVNDAILMLDSSSIFSIDLSIKKKIDYEIIDKKHINYLIQESKNLVQNNYKNFRIIHIIINKYFFDEREFSYIPKKNIKCNTLILEIKFILFPELLIQKITDSFKKIHISLNKIYCSTYIKSLRYLNFFENYKYKVFLDIGYKKTCLALYENSKLLYINNIPIGGSHITKDISKVLKIDLLESEKLKKTLNETDVTFSDVTEDQIGDNKLNKEEFKDLLNKIIYARIEEIISMSFKNNFFFNFLKNDEKSILIFTGDGSKILNKNSIYLKEEFNIFDEMNFFEESSEQICSSALKFSNSQNFEEVEIIPKKSKKSGFFEKLFYFFK